MSKDPNKADRLVDEGKVRKEMETDRRTYFQVEGDTETHSVVFDKSKMAWSCDCKYSSLKNKECSHISAARILEDRRA